jgi:tetratricopeptide (TPR) repeat protein
MHHRSRPFPLLVLACCWLAAPAGAQAPERASVREYRTVMRTYPYADPNPIPVTGRIYPYFRFDRYTNAAVDRAWTVVELENPYLIVRVMPEIGGKIWTAIDKTTGRPFVYDNGVVKFRDIAMRGPWTSGGIEANYGIIGHTPNCATPVDYVTRMRPDGSASVVIGTLDLLTRTPWRLEIALPPDKAYFTTRSLWHNATPLEQPYYHWMNAGIAAAGNLQLVFPGTHRIGHAGELAPWPIDAATGRDLSYYENNDFGSYKSYHVLGTAGDVFGAYWHDHGFGMGRVARRDDKLGKKIWIWGLSQQGMIWEKLLSDTSGQYVEVQSGRLFNQAAEGSSRTPFKHLGFAPYATDTWAEHWFPVGKIGGFVLASEHGALNLADGPDGVEVRLSPLQRVADTLEVFDGERRVYAHDVNSIPLRPWRVATGVRVPRERLRVRLAAHGLEYDGAAGAGALSRPLTTPAAFDWTSVYGRWLEGKELIRQRSYADAQRALESALAGDPYYVPALVDLAMLRFRALDAARARDLARTALSIDAYDPGANYYYALATAELGAFDDARDGFEVAAVSSEFRVAAWSGLARLWMRRGQVERAATYATRAIEASPLTLEARQVLALAQRVAGDREGAARTLAGIEQIDALSHFVHAERWIASSEARDRAAFTGAIRNELPAETYLELAAWYAGLGRFGEADRVLEAAPAQGEVQYWRAWLASQLPDRAERVSGLLAEADHASPALVFPFRTESARVFEWAATQSTNWRPKYYLALVHASRGEAGRALEWFERCADAPDYAPFYAARAEARRGRSPGGELADLRRAAALDPAQWRVDRRLVERALAEGRPEEAYAMAGAGFARAPDNYVLGLALAKTAIATRRYDEAAALLARLEVLPYEGSTEGRRLHREAHLMRAVSDLRAGRVEAALASIERARTWPENLGAGQPYRADVDERLEDWMAAESLARAGRATEARAALERIASATSRTGPTGWLLVALACQGLGRTGEARQAFDRAVADQSGPAWRDFAAALFAGAQPPTPAAVGADDELRVLAALAAGQ